MAQIVNNTKGFKVIETTQLEIVDTFGSAGICDFCARPSYKGYLIAVLNSWYCPHCYSRWVNETQRHPDDEEYEERKFEYFRRLFKVS